MSGFVSLRGFLDGEPIKKEVKGRELVIFQLGVADEVSPLEGGEKITKRYLFTILVWDALAMKVLHNCSKGEYLIVEGKLTSRPVKGHKYLKVEVVAFLVEDGASTDAELEEARTEAETIAEISRNGLPF
jgi:single-stranded DNA-binding protein